MAPVPPPTLTTNPVFTSVQHHVRSGLFRRAATSTYNPGAGTINPEHINNGGLFALFALLGVAMVLGALWFFFWAKNGGFVWRKGDWEDYKSTVLRRKGKDGKTLSNATPVTDLGQKSVAGTFDNEKREEMAEVRAQGHQSRKKEHRHHHRHHPHREPSDEDVRAYRQEKAARVGGLNRQHDGIHSDYTGSTEYFSDTVSNNSRTHLQPKPAPPKKKGFMEKKKELLQGKMDVKKRKKAEKEADRTRQRQSSSGTGLLQQQPARFPSRYTDDVSTVAEERGPRDSSYYNNYRPSASANTPRRSGAHRHSPRSSQPHAARQSSPLKDTTFAPRTPGGFDAYSDTGSSETGTKSYPHHIPGISRGSGRDSGFRRGGGGGTRRDSLSDSE